jgi:hypothetical protein
MNPVNAVQKKGNGNGKGKGTTVHKHHNETNVRNIMEQKPS